MDQCGYMCARLRSASIVRALLIDSMVVLR